MEPQRISDIKKSLDGMSMEELQQMSNNLSDLIQVLVARQVAVEAAILDRLETSFAISE
jgi:HPt (histidine-containing phosphotransfer) domain-containing protein